MVYSQTTPVNYFLKLRKKENIYININEKLGMVVGFDIQLILTACGPVFHP